jgi:NAD(P)-dependent dehydrogenase (short-subunit alcohol dehydrogenase family)
VLLENRIAIVTGGAGRLGKVIAATLQREGAAVAIADQDRARIDAVVATLTARPAIGVAVDVREPDSVARMLAEANQALGQVDLLVNCHGYVPNAPLVEMDVADWDRVFAVNCRGTMLCCQAVARQWIMRDVRGAIVNISSGAGRSARAGSAHYASSKAAVNMMTEVMAIELGPHGIRVNAVAPGLVMDEVIVAEQPNLHPYLNMMLKMTPMGRTGAPQDIAETVVFAACERAGWTTGAVFEVDGGSHCGRPHVPLTGKL